MKCVAIEHNVVAIRQVAAAAYCLASGSLLFIYPWRHCIQAAAAAAAAMQGCWTWRRARTMHVLVPGGVTTDARTYARRRAGLRRSSGRRLGRRSYQRLLLGRPTLSSFYRIVWVLFLDAVVAPVFARTALPAPRGRSARRACILPRSSYCLSKPPTPRAVWPFPMLQPLYGIKTRSPCSRESRYTLVIYRRA